MRQRIAVLIPAAAMLVAGILSCSMAVAQGAAPPSLEEQLQAQYKLTRMAEDSQGLTVTEAGTVLSIQKGGILGVPPSSMVLCPAKYQDGTLHAPSSFCAMTVKDNSLIFLTGAKVYVTKIEVKPKNEKVSLRIVACDTCNGTNPPTFYRSQVDFQFAKGFLENPDVSKIEDAIGEVFAIDNGTNNAQAGQDQGQAQAAPAPAPAPASTRPALSNDDVVKMVSAKLPNSVIVKKIKSSACAFDTSPDALVKLQKAGVSEAVIDAMVDKQ